MTKEELAALLDEMGTLLELKGENPFRCQAYHNGARAVLQMEGDLADVVQSGKLAGVPGIGETLREKISALVTTGKLQFLDDLRKQVPAGMVQMLRLPGVGPKKVKALHETLGIDTLDKLKAACESGEVAKLKGFGEKTQAKILEGIATLEAFGNRVRIDQSEPLAMALLEKVRKMPGVIRAEVAGSLRRRRDTTGDIDIVASAADAAPIMQAFVTMPQVIQVTSHGETKSSTVVSDFVNNEKITLNADLRVVDDSVYPYALFYFTGDKQHNIRTRQRAIDRGLKLNEYELAGHGKKVPAKDETDIYAALEMDYVPPEMRQDTGEVELAAWVSGKSQGKVPKLIEFSDIRGVFHNHTTASDGKATLEEMAKAAKALGFEYLGIADHSQSLTIANGLTPDRVREQWKEIDALNKKLKGIRILKGTECDILEDGSLDFDDKFLEQFEYVVASVHTLFNMPTEVMTERIVRAISNPNVTMLGHATGRLLLRREGYKVDLDAVLQAAAKHRKMIEINAQPSRLDLDWVYVKRAKALGIPLVINPDAHSTGELAYTRYGVDVARRGWLEKGDVFNTKSLAEVKKTLGLS